MELKEHVVCAATGEGWTYNYGIDFPVKAGELGGGPRLAFVEYTTRAARSRRTITHGTEARSSMC